MKKDQLLVDFFKESDCIEVQCNWLQKELIEKNQIEVQLRLKEDTVQKLLFKIDCLEARLEVAEIVRLTLDERA